jgi:hypothetical protein
MTPISVRRQYVMPFHLTSGRDGHLWVCTHGAQAVFPFRPPIFPRSLRNGGKSDGTPWKASRQKSAGGIEIFGSFAFAAGSVRFRRLACKGGALPAELIAGGGLGVLEFAGV